MIWEKALIAQARIATKEEVLLLISLLREEETRTDGVRITILGNSFLSRALLIIIPVLFLQKSRESKWWCRLSGNGLDLGSQKWATFCLYH